MKKQPIPVPETTFNVVMPGSARNPALLAPKGKFEVSPSEKGSFAETSQHELEDIRTPDSEKDIKYSTTELRIIENIEDKVNALGDLFATLHSQHQLEQDQKIQNLMEKMENQQKQTSLQNQRIISHQQLLEELREEIDHKWKQIEETPIETEEPHETMKIQEVRTILQKISSEHEKLAKKESDLEIPQDVLQKKQFEMEDLTNRTKKKLEDINSEPVKQRQKLTRVITSLVIEERNALHDWKVRVHPHIKKLEEAVIQRQKELDKRSEDIEKQDRDLEKQKEKLSAPLEDFFDEEACQDYEIQNQSQNKAGESRRMVGQKRNVWKQRPSDYNLDTLYLQGRYFDRRHVQPYKNRIERPNMEKWEGEIRHVGDFRDIQLQALRPFNKETQKFMKNNRLWGFDLTNKQNPGFNLAGINLRVTKKPVSSYFFRKQDPTCSVSGKKDKKKLDFEEHQHFAIMAGTGRTGAVPVHLEYPVECIDIEGSKRVFQQVILNPKGNEDPDKFMETSVETGKSREDLSEEYLRRVHADVTFLRSKKLDHEKVIVEGIKNKVPQNKLQEKYEKAIDTLLDHQTLSPPNVPAQSETRKDSAATVDASRNTVIKATNDKKEAMVKANEAEKKRAEERKRKMIEENKLLDETSRRKPTSSDYPKKFAALWDKMSEIFGEHFPKRTGNKLTEKQWDSIIELITVLSEACHLNCKLITSPEFITVNLRKVSAKEITHCRPNAELLLIGIESDIRKTPEVVEQDKVEVYEQLLSLGEAASAFLPLAQRNKENAETLNLFNDYVFANFEPKNLHRSVDKAQERIEEVLKFVSSIQELSQSGYSQKVTHPDSFMRSIHNVKALVRCKDVLRLNFSKIYWYWKLLPSLKNRPELPSHLEALHNRPLWVRQARILTHIFLWKKPYIALGIKTDFDNVQWEIAEMNQDQVHSRLEEDEKSGLTIPTIFS